MCDRGAPASGRPTPSQPSEIRSAKSGVCAYPGPDFEFGGDVRLAFVDAAGGEPVLISTQDGKAPNVRPTR